MTVPTWVQAHAIMSICVNGTYIPFKSAPDALQRFVRPAVFTTHDDLFELQKFGAVFMGKYRNWSFGLLTAHQTSGLGHVPSAKNFVVDVDGARRAIPPTAVFRPKIDDQDEISLEDLTFLHMRILSTELPTSTFPNFTGLIPQMFQLTIHS